MTELLLFGSTFVAVFALGVQSLNVNNGHYLAAFLTSFIIGAGNLVLLKLVPGETSALEIAAYFAGGPFGIIAAMRWHRWFFRGKPRKPDTTVTIGVDASHAIESAQTAGDHFHRLGDAFQTAARDLHRLGDAFRTAARDLREINKRYDVKLNIDCGADKP